MTGILGAVETWLLNELLSEASSPEIKAYALNKLKALEVSSTNPLLKAMLQAAEGFLAAPAA